MNASARLSLDEPESRLNWSAARVSEGLKAISADLRFIEVPITSALLSGEPTVGDLTPNGGRADAQ